MCGLAAILGNHFDAESTLKEMISLVNHRGPDSRSVKKLNNCEVALAHSRLEIVDHDPNSNQPMVSVCGDYNLIFNGEIYNHDFIREELVSRGYEFNTFSDTEVILNSFQEWGVECLERFNGMFALILVDSAAKRVFLARDRFGVKPIYFSFAKPGCVYVASEIKQFSAVQSIQLSENNSAVANFLKFGSMPCGSETFFNDVMKVLPGHYVELDLDNLKPEFFQEKWYSIQRQQPKGGLISESYARIFDDSLKLRLSCAVKRGLGFSGGLDSSAILFSLDDKLDNHSDIETFSGRFKEKSVDEGTYIEAGRQHSSLQHNDVEIAPRLSRDYLTKLAWSHDEPILTSAVIAQDKVYEAMAEKGVRVSIDGLGADEALGGYKSFYRTILRASFLKGSPRYYAAQVKAMCSSLDVGLITPLSWTASSLLPDSIRTKLRGVIRRLKIPDRMFSESLNRNCSQPNTAFESLNSREYSEYLFTNGSLPPQLQWADRNSMRHSIETRSPFLDYRLVEYTLGLPSALKLDRGLNKIVLRKELGPRIPSKILSRVGKQGFESPEVTWLCSDNIDEITEFLESPESKKSGLLSRAGHRYLNDILEGRKPYNSILWRYVSIIAWRNAFWHGQR